MITKEEIRVLQMKLCTREKDIDVMAFGKPTDCIFFSFQAEKAKQLLYQAKYGRFGLGDPFHAMQRDSDSQKDNSFDEAAVKAMYDNQLMQLENLIATQRKAQQRMREQLAAVEKRYHKVCSSDDLNFSFDFVWCF